MNAHPFVTRVAVHARDLAFGIVKTHQSLHVCDRQKCRIDRIFPWHGLSIVGIARKPAVSKVLTQVPMPPEVSETTPSKSAEPAAVQIK